MKKVLSVVHATRNEMKTKSTFYLLDSRIVLHDALGEHAAIEWATEMVEMRARYGRRMH